ncbi:hypothetical protein BDZ90DRAFT_105907 [Jaminaea rosea]|uniref:Uncharacterized protein n=1 Tax=Jaminaea rosea TaxID=1569628 RepID=A0A316UVN5_9BASI|nr:hypothetical protein BDZ90DRAFT_105907 [Jaminaea rosea]PWN29339.1 hypothetical protein BDZ90DRAFT_105907 [Jaminaea rosea]
MQSLQCSLSRAHVSFTIALGRPILCFCLTASLHRDALLSSCLPASSHPTHNISALGSRRAAASCVCIVVVVLCGRASWPTEVSTRPG